MNSYGLIAPLLEKVKAAQTPPRFTVDFLETKLGKSGGSARPFIPFIKRLGLLGTDGVPTDRYRRFRNPVESGKTMLEAIREGYSELFARNEYACDLKDEGLKGLVVEITGLEQNSPTVRAIVQSFCELMKFVSLDEPELDIEQVRGAVIPPVRQNDEQTGFSTPPKTIGLGLSYTVNLNLPETADVAVFNAIFKSLRENLLKQ